MINLICRFETKAGEKGHSTHLEFNNSKSSFDFLKSLDTIDQSSHTDYVTYSDLEEEEEKKVL